jgi:putative ABC transport system substrate-binding protein
VCSGSTPQIPSSRSRRGSGNELAARGHTDGRNIRLENRPAEGHVDRLPELAEALVRENPTVIVALGEAPTRAAQHATSTIPIVTVADDIVEAGF